MMDMDPITLMLSVVFGLIGMGMFTYGKKMQRIACIVAGLSLMAAPYLVPGRLAIFLVCAALTAVPTFWKV